MPNENYKSKATRSAATPKGEPRKEGYRTIKSPPKRGTVSIAAVRKAVKKVSRQGA